MKAKNIAKVVVLDDAGKVLLLRRSKTDPNRPGDWDFPGGAVEEDEGFDHAAARELEEEIGIKVQPTDLTLIYTGTGFWEPDNIVYSRFLYKLHLDTGAALKLSSEHDSYEWKAVETALVEFTHTFYNAGLRFANEHRLL